MEGIMGETTSFYAPSETNIEQLQVILAQKSGTDVTFEEAKEIGVQLLSLYECLARDRKSHEDEQGHE